VGKIVDLKVGKRALDDMSWITYLKPHLFMLLIYLRLLDLVTTAVGVRAGLTELNPIFHVRGVEGLIEVNLLLFAPLLVLYVATHFTRDKGLAYLDAVFVGLLLAFNALSLYTVVWNNVRVIAGG